MNAQTLRFILGRLPRGRTKFYSFQGEYMFQLLAWHLREKAVKVADLKASTRWRRFCDQPRFADFLKQLPDGIVTADTLKFYWPMDALTHAFRLTLDQWGSSGKWLDDWYQTSRCGWNLVLQLNFSSAANRAYRATSVDGTMPCLLGSSYHPVKKGEENTMAWARLDIDLDRGVALIEEIQNDWLRDAVWTRGIIRKELSSNKLYLNSTWRGVNVGRFLVYCEQHIVPLLKVWDEFTLLAALSFLYEALGIHRIYYHTWESGLCYKLLSARSGPPRSLYTKLPQRFAFKRVVHGPDFVMENTRRHRLLRKRCQTYSHPQWWLMDLRKRWTTAWGRAG